MSTWPAWMAAKVLLPIVRIRGSGSAPTGFATKNRTSGSRELLSRLRVGITKAQEDASASPAGGSTADELAKWARLRDDGVISDHEFAAQKIKLHGK